LVAKLTCSFEDVARKKKYEDRVRFVDNRQILTAHFGVHGWGSGLSGLADEFVIRQLGLMKGGGGWQCAAVDAEACHHVTFRCSNCPVPLQVPDHAKPGAGQAAGTALRHAVDVELMKQDSEAGRAAAARVETRREKKRECSARHAWHRSGGGRDLQLLEGGDDEAAARVEARLQMRDDSNTELRDAYAVLRTDRPEEYLQMRTDENTQQRDARVALKGNPAEYDRKCLHINELAKLTRAKRKMAAGGKAVRKMAAGGKAVRKKKRVMPAEARPELLAIGREALPLLTAKKGPTTSGPAILKTPGGSKFILTTSLLEMNRKYKVSGHQVQLIGT
jgi:hypothetical protein